MNEISLILKNEWLISLNEFLALERYAHTGRIWCLVELPTVTKPFVTRMNAHEYIFEPESLTMFGIISTNILITWETDRTRHLGPQDEYHLRESLLIRPIS